jgi:hypothetical protein
VQVLSNRTPLEVEIESSDRLLPKTQVLTGPDRLVVDFPQAIPGEGLRNQILHRSELKGVRVGLLSAKPPVTRVVFDLNGPQAYQIFPSGRTVIIKVGSGLDVKAAAPAAAKLVNTNFPVPSVHPQPEQPQLAVSFRSGMLTINSNKSNLAEVLFAVHQRTGAEISIPSGAEQEQVFGQIGPASPQEVLSHLLNGTKFNFLIVSAANDPNILDRVILSAKPEGPAPAYHPPPPGRAQPEEEPADTSQINQPPAPPPSAAPTAPDHDQPPTPPDTKAPAQNEAAPE